jgi:hypothetical protein
MDRKLETLSTRAKRSLASWLRKRFAGSVPACLLARISDDSLVEQYFKQGEEKRQSLANLNFRADSVLASQNGNTRAQTVSEISPSKRD